ncbi:MAG: nitrile hydratase subunit beta [Burkholderiaceae bacterium]|nr:nitrile hydratase subunit beta [Burkholderiaceae bacterium]
MTGIWRTSADLGGLPGFGRVEPEADEPLFHASWEPMAMAITVALGASGRWTIDHSRSARESLPVERYRANTYYQIWLDALETQLLRYGMATTEELATGEMRIPPVTLPRKLAAADVAATLARGAPTERPATAPARFSPGDRVRTSAAMPTGHTRLPVYSRGKVGVVRLVHGAHVYPDVHATGEAPPYAEDPQWLYTVEFDGRELWGDDAEPGTTVSIDAWEPYLEPVSPQ